MIIDFHTHFFPDRIAKVTVEKLARDANIPCHGDGTLASLLASMRAEGVDLSVSQPVATRPEQVVGINRKMLEVNRAHPAVHCFGAMHPLFAGFDEELAFLKENGVKGIKFHPEYQSFYPEDDRLVPLYEACAKYGLTVLFHAGADDAFPDVHGTPQGFARLTAIKRLTFVLAHMGGYRLWDDVEKHLVGKNVYFDLACCDMMDNAQLRRIIVDHGADRVLFATDFPWERASVLVRKLDALALPAADREKILFRNAARLLGLANPS